MEGHRDQQHTPGRYPVNLTIGYPDQFDRLTVFLRLLLALPALLILATLVGTGTQEWSGGMRHIATTGLVVVPTILMIRVRGKYPRWWFDWNVSLIKSANRILSHVLLLRNECRSPNEEQALHNIIPHPEERDPSRWLPLLK